MDCALRQPGAHLSSAHQHRRQANSLFIVVSAIAFNSVNGWSNARIRHRLGVATRTTGSTIRAFLLIAIMAIGAAINLQSDNILRRRVGGEASYRVPHGGLFERVSCPNFLGEIVEWTGFAIACWSLPALGFAVWTAANLIPRAISHHRWYKRQFVDYPPQRRALIPDLI
ncbi:MAG: hypothetical protein H6891_03210 [Brucellaceae bacterium]|nr:hypothetical protein [Brucellaceae bacterium]